MITPYVRPQDTITQLLQQAAERNVSRRNPVVIGPQYNLYLNDGRDLSGAYVDFDDAGGTGLAYTDARGVALNLSALKPQASTAELYGSGLQALVASFDGAPTGWLLDEDDATFRSLRIPTNNLHGGTLNAGLDGRGIKVGDYISSAWDDGTDQGTSRRRVTALLGKVTASSFVSTAVGVMNPTAQGAAAAVKVAANSTAGLDVEAVPTINATDVTMLRAAGKVQVVSGAYKLCDVLDFTCVVGGDNTTATFNVTSLATGITTPSPVTATAGGDGTEFTIDLTTAGYTGATELIITKAADMVTGNKIRVILQPVFAPNAGATLTVAGTYTAPVSRRYAIEITAIGASDFDVNVYDVTGGDPALQYTDVIAAGSMDIGASGLTFDPAGPLNGHAKGQIYYVDATAKQASAAEFTGVVLDGPAVPSANVSAAGGAALVEFTNVSVFQPYSGVLTANNTSGVDEALVADAAEWSYAAVLGLPASVTGRTGSDFSPFADTYGSVYLSYKALVIPSATEAMIEINRETDIVTKVGETSMENWLGRGALEAFRGNQNSVVYALRTGGDTVEDFTTALRKIQTTDRAYALVGLTDNEDVMLLLRDHCTLMSNKYNKNFRRAYVGTDSPGAYVHWGVLPGGGYRTGDLVSSVVTLDEAFRADWQFLATDVGSTVTIQSIGLTVTILEVLSDFEVLTDALDTITELGSNLILTRADSPVNTALYVRNRSKLLGSRRISNVWCDDPTVVENGVTKVLPLKFVAAEIAGLRCALLPQQGLTMTEVLSVSAATSMFTVYDPEDLDAVAADGTFIVTQETEGGDVFVRHQLTTGTDEGALAYEDNVGVIVDEFAYAEKDAFRGYIGRRNATPDTVAEISDKLKALATEFTLADLTNRDIGPAVASFYDEKGNEGEVTVRQDAELTDTLMTYVKLRVPLPLNGINHFIDVEVAELLTSEAV